MITIQNDIIAEEKNPLATAMLDDEMFKVLWEDYDINVGQHDNPDYVFAMSNDLEVVKPNTIGFERVDGCQVRNRPILSNPNLLRLVKMHRYEDLETNNLPCVNGRIFTRTLTDKYDPPEEPLTKEELAKVCNGLSFLHYERHSKTEEIVKRSDIQGERAIDVFFAGTTDYGDDKEFLGSLITQKRKQCADILSSMQVVNNLVNKERNYGYLAYIDLMLNSKITVSPWGWGEACYRDYEAIMCGCSVIKPRSINKMVSIPDIYKEPYVVFCEPDWSDLAEKVMQMLIFWTQKDQTRVARSNELIKMREPKQKANIIKDIIEGITKGISDGKNYQAGV